MALPVQRDIDERPWQWAAACRSRTVAFYPPVHNETRQERASREHQAKAICGSCPVRQACLDEALRRREPFGIWGGLTEQERRAAAETPV